MINAVKLISDYGYLEQQVLKKCINDSNLYIVQKLERLNVNNAFIDEYDREAVNKKTMISLLDEGIEQDTQQGKKEEKIEIAKKMLKDNLDINIVATYTGLTKEELDKLF